jgi:mannose-6-phosphate isomerase-like protein (cupin superfamily)
MASKETVFNEVSEMLKQLSIEVEIVDTTRPWGGFFVINENSAQLFIHHFFSEFDNNAFENKRISPKILLVEPHKKLSWQYHFRRSELWKLIKGEAGIVRSETDELKDTQNMVLNELIALKTGERHRLVGLNDWGIVAEIWVHTNPAQLSDESDIVRVSDEFGRS